MSEQLKKHINSQIEYLQILDIKIPKELVNVSAIARRAGMSPMHCNELFRGTRKSDKGRQKVRKAVIDLYSNIIQKV